MRNKKLVIIITAIISVLVIAIAITSVFLLSPSASYTRKVREAENLVEEGDYENAVLAYQEAIEKDPDNVEAYLGLANLYEKNGEISLAVAILEQGYARTHSAQIKVLLNQMVETEEETVGSETLTFNDELLSMLSTFREEDYEEQYGRSDGRRDARFDGLDAEIRFDEDGIPIEIHLDDILTLFDRSEPIPVEELENMRLEGYRTRNSASHGEMVVFESSGTEVTIALEDDQVTSDSYNVIVPLFVEKESEENEEQELEEDVISENVTQSDERTNSADKLLVVGQTVDITTEAIISYVNISVYKIQNNRNVFVADLTSDSNGNFQISLDKNFIYHATLEKGDYVGFHSITTYESSLNDGNLGYVHLHKTSDETRVILDWESDQVSISSVIEVELFGIVGEIADRGTFCDENGEAIAYKEMTEIGSSTNDVTRFVDVNKPWYYKVRIN